MATILLFTILFYLLLLRIKYSFRNIKLKMVLIIAVAILFIAIIFLIGWSRIYLGAHSYSNYLILY